MSFHVNKNNMEVFERLLYITIHKGLIKPYISKIHRRIYLIDHTTIFNPSPSLGTLYLPNFSESIFLVEDFAIFLVYLAGLGSFKA